MEQRGSAKYKKQKSLKIVVYFELENILPVFVLFDLRSVADRCVSGELK